MEKNIKLKNILRAITEFSNTLPLEEKMFCLLLEELIIDIVMQVEYKSNLKLFSRWNSIVDFIKHIPWIILWKIKYLLFYNKNDNKAILSHIVFNSKSSYSTMQLLANKYKILIIGALHSKKMLLSRNIFCFVSIFHKKQKLNLEFIEKIYNYCLTLFKKYEIELSSYKQFKQQIEIKYRIYTKYKNIYNKIDQFSISISDFIFHNYNYLYQITKEKGKKNILFDHGIIFYDNLYENLISDYYLACGEYDYYKNKNTGKKDIVGIVGKNYNFIRTKTDSQKKYILYILSPYFYSFARTEGRNLNYSVKYYNKFCQVSKYYFSDKRIMLRAHPVDKINKLKKEFGGNFYQNNLNKIIDNIAFCMVEDTSLALDLLRYDIPIIYIPDQFGIEHIKFSKFNLNISLPYENISYGNIQKILKENEENFEKRQQIYEYYYAPFEKNKFMEIIDEAIQSSSNNCHL
jgi:hypothetical protein